jgi:dipeptidase
MEKYEKYAMGLEKSPRMPLWIKPDKKLSLHDVQELMRDHFEGTPMDMTQDIGAGPYQCPYRWRPLVWEYKDTSYFNERAISTQQTGFSFVSQSRAHLPDPVGGILWFGVDDTYSTCYLPMYCGINEVPHSFAVGTGTFDEFTWESAFWTFNFVSNFTYSRYKDMIVDVRAVQQEYENKFITYQPAIDEAVKVLYENNPLFAEQFLTDYSANQAAEVVERWKKLAGELLYKYLDGNPKSPEGEVTHPPYPEFWYRKILEETGDFFKMR